MARTLQLDKSVCMFDKFSLIIPSNHQYYMDGKRNHRVLFITDEQEDMLISFEEDMECMDMLRCIRKKNGVMESEYHTGNKYLHQTKQLAKETKRNKDLVFFHMEVPDENGVMHVCPGQLLRTPDMQQKDGVEPVLKEILEGLTVITI